ncbi:MAG TPA: hypothetical protein VN670_09875 [Acidobacteriaceae bacterium]|nr:hypothetical protein [Acidobacteriaceae bacterium]
MGECDAVIDTEEMAHDPVEAVPSVLGLNLAFLLCQALHVLFNNPVNGM